MAAFVLAIVATIGMYAALDENKVMLRLYVSFTVITIIVEIIAGLVVFMFLTDLNNAKTSKSSDFEVRIDKAINETFCDCCNITTVSFGCNEVGVRAIALRVCMCTCMCMWIAALTFTLHVVMMMVHRRTPGPHHGLPPALVCACSVLLQTRRLPLLLTCGLQSCID